jgi:uncharacterized protein (TIGR03000 family)
VGILARFDPSASWETASMRKLGVVVLLVVFVTGETLLPREGPAVPPDHAHILVKLPADATLTIAGDPTTQTGPSRLFASPKLQPGKKYNYELVATWSRDGKPATVKRVVEIQAGKQTEVDLTTFDPTVTNPEKATAGRTFEFTYETTVTGLKPGEPGSIWLPVAITSADQKVEIVSKKLPEAVKIGMGRESRYGNEIMFVEAKADAEGKIPIKVVYKVTRFEVKGEHPGKVLENPDLLDRYLKPDVKVPITGKPLELIKDKELPKDPFAAARIFYDTVNGHMRYSKEGKGWGEGDSVWACESKYGNCTDFHSVFISLARGHKIPAKFEMGFSIPEQHGEGKVGGYHCWAKFLVEGKGWIPVDISEANKDPKLKDYYFGNLTSNRVGFTVGRDIDLLPKQAGPPLNYFVYPYVEVEGKAYPREKIINAFSFKDVGG